MTPRTSYWWPWVVIIKRKIVAHIHITLLGSHIKYLLAVDHDIQILRTRSGELDILMDFWNLISSSRMESGTCEFTSSAPPPALTGL